MNSALLIGLHVLLHVIPLMATASVLVIGESWARSVRPEPYPLPAWLRAVALKIKGTA